MNVARIIIDANDKVKFEAAHALAVSSDDPITDNGTIELAAALFDVAGIAVPPPEVREGIKQHANAVRVVACKLRDRVAGPVIAEYCEQLDWLCDVWDTQAPAAKGADGR